jgi:ABC-type anion transport system duplicated permease subunit
MRVGVVAAVSIAIIIINVGVLVYKIRCIWRTGNGEETRVSERERERIKRVRESRARYLTECVVYVHGRRVADV